MSQKSEPLVELTRDDIPFHWDEEQQQAFDLLKAILTTPPLLSHFHPEWKTRLYTDASNLGFGFALIQEDESGRLHPIAYHSRKWNTAQKAYSTIEKEMCAIFLACKTLYPYLADIEFEVHSDHRPLTCQNFGKQTDSRLYRWSALLQEYNIKMKYCPGKWNQVADLLSRYPIERPQEVEETIEVPMLHLVENSIEEYQAHDEDCINIKRRMAEPKIASRYKIINNILYDIRTGCKRLVLPKVMFYEVLTDNHSIPIAGHLGYTKTFNRLSRLYYWKDMKNTIFNFLRACPKCQEHKRNYGKSPGKVGFPYIPTRPFEVISTDICGPLPGTRKQNIYVVNAVCNLTRYVELRAVKRQTTDEVLKFLQEQVFLRHGSPDVVVSDNGGSYVAQLYDEMLKLYGARAARVSMYHSRGNSLAERCHSTMHTFLSTLVNKNKTNWDELLPSLQFAINSTINTSHGYSPFFLVHGREPVFITQFPEEVVDEKVQVSGEQLKNIWKQVANTLKEQQQQRKEKMDLSRKTVHYKPGDLVRLSFPRIPQRGQPRKWVPRFQGVYKVLTKKSEITYQVKDVETGREFRTHVNRMRLIVTFNPPYDDLQEPLYQTRQSLLQEVMEPELLIRRWRPPTISSDFFDSTLDLRYGIPVLIVSSLINGWLVVLDSLKQNKVTQLVLLGILPEELSSVFGVPSTSNTTIMDHLRPKCRIFHLPLPLTKENVLKVVSEPNKGVMMVIGSHWDEFVFRYILLFSLEKQLYPNLETVLRFLQPYSDAQSVLKDRFAEIFDAIRIELEQQIQAEHLICHDPEITVFDAPEPEIFDSEATNIPLDLEPELLEADLPNPDYSDVDIERMAEDLETQNDDPISEINQPTNSFPLPNPLPFDEEETQEIDPSSALRTNPPRNRKLPARFNDFQM